MWLDRLAGHSTPAPSSGPTRPLKTNHLVSTSAFRPPRTSSLLVQNNESTTSLLALGKANRPDPRQSFDQSDASDILQAIQKILEPSRNELNEWDYKNLVHDYYENEFDFEGMGLQQIANAPLNMIETDDYSRQSSEEYKFEKARLEELHLAICACDEVLISVETNLTEFRDDLAKVSSEIETIQARSITLSIRLDNRKNAEQILGPVVEEISISPVVIEKIVDGTIDDGWMKALADVEKKSRTLETKFKNYEHIKGLDNLRPLVENLTHKAIERIRDFLVSQIKFLRSPDINVQIIQQQRFIRYKDMYNFLHKHHPQLSEEICQAYMNTMRWYFLNQFTRYEKALSKIKIHPIDKHDVLGQDDGTRKSITAPGLRSSGLLYDAMNIGRRIDLLKTSNQTALSSFLAEEDRTVHYIEYPFRNFNLALIDNASAEYSFLTIFFTPALSLSTITRHFNYIFEPTFSLGETLTKSLINDTFDCLGILVCVRLNQKHAFELQRRKVPAMEGYINRTSMLLWPRFQLTMDAHCESIRNLTSTLSSRKLFLLEAAKQSIAPHFITQRFGQFLQSILSLSVEAGDNEPVSTSLGRVRGEIESFLAKFGMSMEKRKRDRFLFNNYSLILTILGEVQGKLAAEQIMHFEELKKSFEIDVE